MEEQETFLGIKIMGEWHEVTVESEKACEVLKKHLGEERVRNFEEWKPQIDEDLKEVKKRTIQNNLTNQSKIEKNGEIQEKAKKGVEELKNGDVKNGSTDLFKTIDATIRKTFRPIESFIYNQIIARFNPLFFKDDKLESNIQKKHNGYEMDIAVNDDKARKELKKEMLKNKPTKETNQKDN
ncbi:DUF5828 family protein [Methanonatronarchaeum sp. AMET-Sl]|uniref:DUF5828 family protein n=1 Tax=Methanonatronarchaeum sp. AMET-Sl TaxID=3037654 RepID=UPI00244DBB73|nr:DUF5828 family protein [Methanonatronarchaeum sp. AMET-Sl]WGI18107.1 DUF5828 family protein [Methanonatronarchaeum sp. AMET-Sl]